jgi:hypothetical protein
MIFWLVLKLEIISYRIIIYLEGFWVSFRGFFCFNAWKKCTYLYFQAFHVPYILESLIHYDKHFKVCEIHLDSS